MLAASVVIFALAGGLILAIVVACLASVIVHRVTRAIGPIARRALRRIRGTWLFALLALGSAAVIAPSCGSGEVPEPDPTSPPVPLPGATYPLTKAPASQMSNLWARVVDDASANNGDTIEVVANGNGQLVVSGAGTSSSGGVISGTVTANQGLPGDAGPWPVSLSAPITIVTDGGTLGTVNQGLGNDGGSPWSVVDTTGSLAQATAQNDAPSPLNGVQIGGTNAFSGNFQFSTVVDTSPETGRPSIGLDFVIDRAEFPLPISATDVDSGVPAALTARDTSALVPGSESLFVYVVNPLTATIDGGSLTGNQGTPNAGGVLAWPELLQAPDADAGGAPRTITSSDTSAFVTGSRSLDVQVTVPVTVMAAGGQGVATSALQSSVQGTAGTPATAVVSVQGVVGGQVVPVSGSVMILGTPTVDQGTSPWVTSISAALPAGANTIGAVNQGTSPWVTSNAQLPASPGQKAASGSLPVIDATGKTYQSAAGATPAVIPIACVQIFTGANVVRYWEVFNGGGGTANLAFFDATAQPAAGTIPLYIAVVTAGGLLTVSVFKIPVINGLRLCPVTGGGPYVAVGAALSGVSYTLTMDN